MYCTYKAVLYNARRPQSSPNPCRVLIPIPIKNRQKKARLHLYVIVNTNALECSLHCIIRCPINRNHCRLHTSWSMLSSCCTHMCAYLFAWCGAATCMWSNRYTDHRFIPTYILNGLLCAHNNNRKHVCSCLLGVWLLADDHNCWTAREREERE